MNQEKQRIAIAKACGWRSTQWRGEPEPLWERDGDLFTRLRTTQELPDYLNSLDAMHEAVNTKWKADPYFGMSFAIKLTEVATGLAYSAQVAAECLEDMLLATADQWAEAFLKTLGLWGGE